ncbi:MAG: tryptophanyl-tRNA synthetase [Cyanobacteriota bacterium]|jgi:tryptophanyl-tRNA synthetase
MKDLNNIENEIILTGDRPTGRLHLGHYVGSLSQRVILQKRNKQFVLIADAQALTDNAENPEKVRENIVELALDYLAVGIDPNLTTIYIQSLIPEFMELTTYYLNLVNEGRLHRNPTIKTEIEQRKFSDGVPVGFLVYPVSQAADISGFKATLVPVGEDQKPMIEITNEIVRRFNRIYKTDCLKECRAYVPPIGRLAGTDGQSKMSKSLDNCIYLADSSDIVKEKVMSMFTDPNHLRVEDPGMVEGNPVFTYLDAFATDFDKVEELKVRYRCGGLGDVLVKRYLFDVLEGFMTPIRERREEYQKDLGEVWKILRKGTEDSRAVVAQTLTEVKEAMGINYF